MQMSRSRNFCFKALMKLLLKGNEEKAKLNSLKSMCLKL